MESLFLIPRGLSFAQIFNEKAQEISQIKIYTQSQQQSVTDRIRSNAIGGGGGGAGGGSRIPWRWLGVESLGRRGGADPDEAAGWRTRTEDLDRGRRAARPPKLGAGEGAADSAGGEASRSGGRAGARVPPLVQR